MPDELLQLVSDRAPSGRSVVAVGVFDGVHRGHQAVLAQARAAADKQHLPLVALTFDPHPAAVVRPGTHPGLLSTLRGRAQLLRQAGADSVVALRFDMSTAAMSPGDFVQRVLVDDLHARVVVVGEDFRFGSRAAGSVSTLREIGAGSGFSVEAVPLAGGLGEGRWSSTAVREALHRGDVAAAAAVLGRAPAVEGTVVHGDHRGRTLGYPTANLVIAEHGVVPADGVYAAWLVDDPYGRTARHPAAVSVGSNPTFDGKERRVEAYVLDRDDLDLYGHEVAVQFRRRLRDTLRFDSVDDLLRQMADDVARTRELLSDQ